MSQAKSMQRPTRLLNPPNVLGWRAFWLVIYALMIVAPILIMALGSRPIEREPLREISVMLGFLGLSMMGLQFIPTARLPFLTDVFDLDWLYAVHHRISVISFFAVLAHPILLFVNNPYTLRLLNVFTASRRAQASVAAVLALLVLTVTSVWRKQLEIEYDRWHVVHDVAAILIAALSLYHVFKVNYYTAVPAQRILWIVLAVVWSVMLLYARLIRPWAMARRPYRVVKVMPELGDAWTLLLEPEGHAGMRFLPGQFAWLNVWRSPFAVPHHPFSFASSAERPEQMGFMIKSVGDWTERIKSLTAGTRVYVDGPYGIFSIDQHDAPGYVFIAGGSGVAPVLSMLETLADREDRRPLQLFYGNWGWETVIYRGQLETLASRLNLDLVHVLESPPDGWDGETGYVTPELLDRHLLEARAEYVYFICGPIIMIDNVEKALLDLGVPHNQIHAERYDLA